MAEYVEEMDLTEFTKPEELERPEGVPPGWYLAMVSDVSKDGATDALNIKFEVTDGEFAGQHITERLWDPKRADNPKSADTSKRRRIIWAKRLGIISDADFGKPGVKLMWDEAIGRFFAIKVKERKYKDKDGNEKVANNVDFAGVYPLDHADVPEHLRQANGAAVAEGAENAKKEKSAGNATAGRSAANKAEFDDI